MAKTKMENCPNTKNVYVLGKQQAEKKAIIFHPRCGQWSCDFCAEENKDYWIEQATRGTMIIQSEGREIQFVTLTSRGYTTAHSSLYFFKQNWPKLSRRIKYHTEKWKDYAGKRWDYFLVPEHHKSGVAHFHLLAATHFEAQKFWKKWAFETGFGYIVNVQSCRSAAGAAAYVSKYLHKGMGAEMWPKGFMRVRHSRGWPIAKPKPHEGWQWDTYKQENTIWIEKLALIDMGWHVKDLTE
jgi:hypothetical protein